MLKTRAALISCLAISLIAAGAAAPSAEQLDFFESKVRPLLADQIHGHYLQSLTLRISHLF